MRSNRCFLKFSGIPRASLATLNVKKVRNGADAFPEPESVCITMSATEISAPNFKVPLIGVDKETSQSDSSGFDVVKKISFFRREMPFGDGNSTRVELLPLDQKWRRSRIRSKEIPTRGKLEKVDIGIDERRNLLAEETIAIRRNKYDE